MPNIEETIKDIKTQCRLAMNGMVSTAMRERGMDYRLNFGVEYPRIREIARRYTPDHALASELWKSGIRELQIMAGILQPAETFDPAIADIWISDIHNSELAEMTSMNLLPSHSCRHDRRHVPPASSHQRTLRTGTQQRGGQKGSPQCRQAIYTRRQPTRARAAHTAGLRTGNVTRRQDIFGRRR